MSKLSIGIVGLPNVGKSTLFNLLTRQRVNVANYPFTTVDPNVGVVEVPDERLEQLAQVSAAEKVVAPIVEFYDIAGLVKGAHKGEGLGNQFLSYIKEVKTIVHLVRCFRGGDVAHVDGDVDAARDLETVHTELVLKDLEAVSNRLAKLEREARAGDKTKTKDLRSIQEVAKALNEGKLALTLEGSLLEEESVRELRLLTAKPQIYLLNGQPGDVSEELLSKIRELKSEYLILDLAAAENLDQLVEAAYKTLDLITFYTIESRETRGWTVGRGSTASRAGGVIHTDFEEKFIKADVIPWRKLVEAGAWNEARSKGLVRTEGKNYVVQDGDVLLIKHS